MRFHLIDALRGFAASWIVLGHAFEGEYFSHLAGHLPQLFWLIKYGYLAVPIFFVISGFVIAHSLSNDYVDGRYFLKFTLRRTVRLDPAYWGSILLVISLSWVAAKVSGEIFKSPEPFAILSHIFYLQALIGVPHLISVYWTLCLEIQFYLIFCGLMYFTAKLRPYYSMAFQAVLLFTTSASLIWPLKIVDTPQPLHHIIFLPYWHSFLLGVFSFWCWKKLIPQSYFYLYALTLAIVTIYNSNPSTLFDMRNPSYFTLSSVLTALFIHECARLNKLSSANWRWIQFLGAISYSLYLTHIPILAATAYVTRKTFGNSIYTDLSNLIILPSACIIFAFIFWYVFEKWSIKLSKSIKLHA